MKKLLVIDFQHIYYRYKNSYEYGNLPKLTCDGVDTTIMFNCVKEIVNKGIEYDNVAICFDSKPAKMDSEVGAELGYKSNRKLSLSEYDFDSILAIKELLKKVGYSIYKAEGYESDDIINEIVKDNIKDYEITIMTNDADLAQLINDNVKISLHSSKNKRYSDLTKENYEEVLSAKLKSRVPYNTIKAYKCLVGDSSDGIKGVNKFGAKAFEKWIDSFEPGFDYERLNDSAELKTRIAQLLQDDAKIEQALKCLTLVEFVPMVYKPFPVENKITKDSIEHLMTYQFVSLYKKLSANIQ